MHVNIAGLIFFFSSFFDIFFSLCLSLWNRLWATVCKLHSIIALLWENVFWLCNVHLYNNGLLLFQYPIDFFGVSGSLLYLTTTSRCGNAHPRYQEVNSLLLPLPVCLNNDQTKRCKNTATSVRFHNASKIIIFPPCLNDIHKRRLWVGQESCFIDSTRQHRLWECLFCIQILYCFGDWRCKCHKKTFVSCFKWTFSLAHAVERGRSIYLRAIGQNL